MDRHRALAAAAAVGLSITGLAAAVGATTQVFTAADASPNVGRVSPVSRSVDPEVETHVVDVVDPAPAAVPASMPAPVVRPVPGSYASEPVRPAAPATSISAPPTQSTPALSAPAATPAGEHEPADD